MCTKWCQWILELETTACFIGWHVWYTLRLLPLQQCFKNDTPYFRNDGTTSLYRIHVMVYLPAFGWFLWSMQVGILHGSLLESIRCFSSFVFLHVSVQLMDLYFESKHSIPWYFSGKDCPEEISWKAHLGSSTAGIVSKWRIIRWLFWLGALPGCIPLPFTIWGLPSAMQVLSSLVAALVKF